MMKNIRIKKIEYNDAPKQVAESISLSKRIDDFLPPPDRLIKYAERYRHTIHPPAVRHAD